MLTNFDSEEQLSDWNRVRHLCNHNLKCDQKRVPEVNSKFWSEGHDGVSICERTIQQHPESFLNDLPAFSERHSFIVLRFLSLTQSSLMVSIFWYLVLM